MPSHKKDISSPSAEILIYFSSKFNVRIYKSDSAFQIFHSCQASQDNPRIKQYYCAVRIKKDRALYNHYFRK